MRQNRGRWRTGGDASAWPGPRRTPVRRSEGPPAMAADSQAGRAPRLEVLYGSRDGNFDMSYRNEMK